MLCPECRRMVGKDGYCPQGHLARPELQVEAPKAPTPAPPVPPPPPEPFVRPAAPEATFGPDPGSFPPGLGPSNPEQGAVGATMVAGGPTMPGTPPAMPDAAPPLPSTDRAIGARLPRRRGLKAIVAVLTLAAVVIVAIVFLGGSAGASNLKLVFTPGETHTYSFELTVRGRAGNLSGGFVSDSAIAADLTQRTGAIDKDGSARLTYTISNLHFSAGGRRIDAPAGAGGSFVVKMRRDGRIVGLEGGDPFGLEDVNPAGQFVNPANAGPLLPDRRVTPGQKWTVEAKQKLPDIGTVRVTAVNTLKERGEIDGNDTAVISSVVSVPLDIHIGRNELVKQAKNNGGSGSDIPDGAGISMIGRMHFNLTQTIFTANGLLQSALGDGEMTGTMTLEGLPGGPQSIVFDLQMGITMLKTSTGQSA